MEHDDAAGVIGAGPYGLAFAGVLAGYAFGPLCRFVVGSRVTAGQVARHASRATNSGIPYPLLAFGDFVTILSRTLRSSQRGSHT